MAAKKKTTGATRTKRASASKATATKNAAPAAAKTKPKAPAKKAVKLSEAQEKFLKALDSAGDAGYEPANKTELRTLEKLREYKLAKRGAKNKETGQHPYLISAAGKKHLAAS